MRALARSKWFGVLMALLPGMALYAPAATPGKHARAMVAYAPDQRAGPDAAILLEQSFTLEKEGDIAAATQLFNKYRLQHDSIQVTKLKGHMQLHDDDRMHALRYMDDELKGLEHVLQNKREVSLLMLLVIALAIVAWLTGRLFKEKHEHVELAFLHRSVCNENLNLVDKARELTGLLQNITKM